MLKRNASKSTRKHKKTHLNEAVMEDKAQESRSHIRPDFMQTLDNSSNDLLSLWAQIAVEIIFK